MWTVGSAGESYLVHAGERMLTVDAKSRTMRRCQHHGLRRHDLSQPVTASPRRTQQPPQEQRHNLNLVLTPGVFIGSARVQHVCTCVVSSQVLVLESLNAYLRKYTCVLAFKSIRTYVSITQVRVLESSNAWLRKYTCVLTFKSMRTYVSITQVRVLESLNTHLRKYTCVLTFK